MFSYAYDFTPDVEIGSIDEGYFDLIRRIRPQVVFTFPPDGAYGHPDHIAISQFTAAALVCAFAGRELILHTYEIAKREGYRFFSFGDAMLIL